MTDRQELQTALDALLQPERFKDYCPNGLQVEGSNTVCKIVSGVTASLALIDAAIAQGADTIFVHHGLFWRGFDGRVTGWMRQRLGRLLEHNINLFAYHLPLDAHAEFGNNAQFGARLGITVDTRFGEQSLGFIGTLSEPASVADLVGRCERLSGRSTTAIDGDGRALARVAWCTGGAQSYFESAIAAGADVFITGEISEPQAHLARETGVAFIAVGHHASERYGVQALGTHLAATFGIEHSHIEIDNPA